MTTHNALHSKSNVDCLYIPRKKGGRGLQGIKEAVKLTNVGSENYVRLQRAFAYCHKICRY